MHGFESKSLPVDAILTDIHDRYLTLTDGALPDYIPELANADPAHFGIAIATCDGFVYDIGDAGHPFTIQSVSKPIVYGLALEDHGRDAVLKKIGVEPSGDPFNSITFDERTNRPFNPMVNAGAIAAAALVRGSGVDERFARILDKFNAFAGRRLTVDEAIYQSERATGHRNRAIAWLERNSGMIDDPVDEHLDLYFRQCAIEVTAVDLAVMAATLANDGNNPLTGERALAAQCVRDVLSVMSTCGMYNYAGGWQFGVGLPAKSGVAGGVMAVLPGKLGIGVFSPLLDEFGNSSRGVAVCSELSQRLKLHLLDHRGSRQTAIRRAYRVSDSRSNRVRCQADREHLDRVGAQALVVELQGDLFFADIELVTRRVLSDSRGVRHIILDGERAARIDEVAFDLIQRLASRLATEGRTLSLVLRPETINLMQTFSTPEKADYFTFAELDAALEHAEDRMLAAIPGRAAMPPRRTIADIDLFAGFTPADLARLGARMETRRYRRGEWILRDGTEAEGLFLLMSGSVDVCIVRDGDTTLHRLAKIDAGNVFGELAILERPRTADVVAAEPAETLYLSKPAIEAMLDSEPKLYHRLLVAIGQSLAERLRRANHQIRALA